MNLLLDRSRINTIFAPSTFVVLKTAKSLDDKWEFYLDGEKKWRWRRIASNGKIIGASTQGYANKSDCVENARKNGYTGS